MDELIRQIKNDLERDDLVVNREVVKRIKERVFMLDEELLDKLCMLVLVYYIDIRQSEHVIAEQDKELKKFYKKFEELRRQYDMSYREQLHAQHEMEMKPADKMVSGVLIKQCLDSGLSIAETCGILGISRTTLWRRKKLFEKSSEKAEKDRTTETKIDTSYRLNL